MPPRRTHPAVPKGERPEDRPGYRTVDLRALARCSVCGAYVQAVDEPRHTRWHEYIVTLAGKLAALEQPTLDPFGQRWS